MVINRRLLQALRQRFDDDEEAEGAGLLDAELELEVDALAGLQRRGQSDEAIRQRRVEAAAQQLRGWPLIRTMPEVSARKSGLAARRRVGGDIRFQRCASDLHAARRGRTAG